MSDCVRRERQLQHYWWRLLALNENVNPGSAQEKWGPPCTPPASLFAKITWPVSWSGGGGIKSGKKREEEVDMALMLCLCVIRRKSLKLHWFSFCSVMLRRDASLSLLFFPDALRMHSNCKMFKCKVRSVPRCPLCPTGLRRRVCFVSDDEACLSGFYCLIIYSIAVCKCRCKCKNFQDKWKRKKNLNFYLFIFSNCFTHHFTDSVTSYT